jgi:hypothetical protein
MLDHLAATIAKPVSKSPDKAAIQYLIASSATAISITEVDGVAAFRVGIKIDPNAHAIFWITEVDAKPVAKCARRLAGKNQNIDDAIMSLKKAAVECRATLTAHDVAVARARRGQEARRISDVAERHGRAQGIYAHL